MPTSLLPINGIKLYVDDTGETDLPVVLCLHSLPVGCASNRA